MDVTRGFVMDNFLELHGLTKESLNDSPQESIELAESSQGTPNYSWLDNLLGDNYSRQLQEPIYYPSQLPQPASHEQGESSQAGCQGSQVAQRSRRETRAPNTFTSTTYICPNQRRR